MKITKSHLRKVIQEELAAELNEIGAEAESKDIPAFMGWYDKLINTVGEEKDVIKAILVKILTQNKLPATQKIILFADAFESMGAQGGPVATAVRTALKSISKQSAAPQSNRVRSDQGNELDNFVNDVGGQPRQGMPNYPKQVPFKS